jgi:hypothetical protein
LVKKIMSLTMNRRASWQREPPWYTSCKSADRDLHEEWGDGIMSAIDFKMDVAREPDPKGDRLKIVMSEKYLPHKSYLDRIT